MPTIELLESLGALVIERVGLTKLDGVGGYSPA